jgi:hypothetical protein
MTLFTGTSQSEDLQPLHEDGLTQLQASMYQCLSSLNQFIGTTMSIPTIEARETLHQDIQLQKQALVDSLEKSKALAHGLSFDSNLSFSDMDKTFQTLVNQDQLTLNELDQLEESAAQALKRIEDTLYSSYDLLLKYES